jgi:hypothetical protein
VAGTKPIVKTAGMRLQLMAGKAVNLVWPLTKRRHYATGWTAACHSLVEIRAHVSTKFGLRYSHSGCIKLLAGLGFEYRKPKALPRVLSAEKQATFIALYERLVGDLEADEAVYFADAVHPEYQTKPSHGWVKARSNPAIKTTAGRGRVNIHGTLNLKTFDTPFVEPTTEL